MTLEFRCPQCAKWYKVSDNLAGRKAKCKACGAELVVPTPAAAPAPESREELRPLAGSSLIDEWAAEQAEVSDKPLAPLRRAAPSDVPTAEPPQAKKRRRRSEAPPGDKLGRFALVLLTAAVALLIAGQREWRLASHAKPVAQKMTLTQLAANGPGDNIYIELSECQLLEDQAVIEYEGKDVNDSRWRYVWIPAVPRGALAPLGRANTKVIVGTKEIWNAETMTQFCRRTTLTGLVVNITDSIGSDVRKLLKEDLPGVDVASCHFFRSGQRPVSGTVQTLLLGGGGVCLVAALALGGLYLRARYAQRQGDSDLVGAYTIRR